MSFIVLLNIVNYIDSENVLVQLKAILLVLYASLWV